MAYLYDSVLPVQPLSYKFVQLAYARAENVPLCVLTKDRTPGLVAYYETKYNVVCIFIHTIQTDVMV